MTPPSPQISVGMPVFNGGAYISEAIESILAQTFNDFELIISDNASTDDTEAICRSFAQRDKRIRYLRNPSNLGAAPNFNQTFHEARGAYFKWAAADDLCAPEFLARCLQALESDQGAVLGYSRVIIRDDEVGEDRRYDWDLPTDSADRTVRFKALLRGHGCHEIFGLIRTSALATTPLIMPFSHGDNILLLRLALLGRFVRVDDYLFYSRKHTRQSIRMRENRRSYSVWFDESLRGRRIFPWWRAQYEKLRVAADAGLTLKERLLCIGAVARDTGRKRRALYENLHYHVADAVKGLMNRPGSSG